MQQNWKHFKEDASRTRGVFSIHDDHPLSYKRSTKLSALKKSIHSTSSRCQGKTMCSYSSHDDKLQNGLLSSSRLMRKDLSTFCQRKLSIDDNRYRPATSIQQQISTTSSYSCYVKRLQRQIKTARWCRSLETKREVMSIVSKRRKRESQTTEQQNEQNLLKTSPSNNPPIRNEYDNYSIGKKRKVHALIIQNSMKDLIRRQTWLITKKEELIKHALQVSEEVENDMNH